MVRVVIRLELTSAGDTVHVSWNPYNTDAPNTYLIVPLVHVEETVRWIYAKCEAAQQSR